MQNVRSHKDYSFLLEMQVTELKLKINEIHE